MKTKISFRPKDNKNKTLVMLIVNCGMKEINLNTGKTSYIPIRLSTGIYITQDQWDKEKGFFEESFLKRNPRIKINCDKFRLASEEAIEALKLTKGSNFSKEDVKEQILERMGTERVKPKAIERLYFSDFIRTFIAKNKPTTNPNTLKTYNSFLLKIEDFDKCFYPLNLLTMNSKNVEDFFKEYLSKKFNYTNNTFEKNIGLFSTFLNKAIEEKIKIEIDLTSLKSIKKRRYTPDDIFLTFEEIDLIRGYNSIDPYKNRVRDIFIILCLTGQRIDEYKLIEKAEVIEDSFLGKTFKYIDIVPKTTNGKKKIVCVPILKPVNEILELRGGFPERVPDSKVNEIIKEICEEVGIDSIVQFTEQRVNGNELIKKRRYELVKTHTGRRSFITNFHTMGLQDAVISRITGHFGKHDASKAFGQYLKVTGPQNIALFFQQIQTCLELQNYSLPLELTYNS